VAFSLLAPSSASYHPLSHSALVGLLELLAQPKRGLHHNGRCSHEHGGSQRHVRWHRAWLAAPLRFFSLSSAHKRLGTNAAPHTTYTALQAGSVTTNPCRDQAVTVVAKDATSGRPTHASSDGLGNSPVRLVVRPKPDEALSIDATSSPAASTHGDASTAGVQRGELCTERVGGRRRR
jgi:hypothetical protein